MDYELAKELKDAGFPQMGEPSYRHKLEEAPFSLEEKSYVPTLSELIEACGERLHAFSLEMPFLRPISVKTTWAARGKAEVANKEWQEWTGCGDSPEEAVARLWLALNKK